MKKPFSSDKAVMKRYGDLLADIKTRIRQAQNRAVMSVNAEMSRHTRPYDQIQYLDELAKARSPTGMVCIGISYDYKCPPPYAAGRQKSV